MQRQMINFVYLSGSTYCRNAKSFSSRRCIMHLYHLSSWIFEKKTGMISRTASGQYLIHFNYWLFFVPEMPVFNLSGLFCHYRMLCTERQ